MAGRFIKMYEKLLDWRWFTNPNTLQLFIYLLLKANYKNQTFRGVSVKRGQVITSISKLCQATCQSASQIRVSLNHLEMTGEVTSQTTNRYRIITIVRYDYYQANDKLNDKQLDKQLDKQDDKQDDKQHDNKYRIYIENIEKNRTIEPSNDGIPRDGWAFTMFWNKYPKKVGKKDAVRAWEKLKVNEDMMGAILVGLDRWIGSDQWVRDNGRYIPNPATWLNGRRWEDEVRPYQPEEKKQSSTVSVASEYHQRDYSSEQEAAFRRMMEMEV